jgi:tRNA-splicing ligase RtcB
LSEADVKPRLRELVQSLFKNVPSGVGSKSRIRATEKELEEATRLGVNWAIDKGYGVKEDREHCEENGCFEGSDFSKVSEMARKRGAPQMGTLGSGNHFLEIQKIERVFDPETAKALGVFEGQITVMIHSGSRGFGHQVCDDFVRSMPAVAEKNGVQLPDRELVCAPIQSKEAQDYLGAMRCAINYAFLNRQFMTHWTRECFEQVFKKKWDEMGMNLVYDVCHNIAKFEEHEVEGKNRRVCVHRKGATRAFWKGRKEIPRAYANLGQPVIIPGSMNTASYLLLGQEGAKECFGSSCHGAGRVMSRAAAIRQFGNQSIAKDMEKKGTLVQATEPRLLAEEFGGAYKNIDSVVSSVEKAGLCKIVARMVPLGVVKG